MSTEKIIELTHEGKGFHSFASITGLANGASISMLGRTGALPVHFHRVDIESSDSPILIEFIESPTVTVVGTPVSIHNRNRRSSNNPDIAVFSDPTFTGGTVLDSRRIYKSGVGSATPGAGQIEGEWVLKSSTDYIFRITNQSGATINLDSDFHFYEEEL